MQYVQLIYTESKIDQKLYFNAYKYTSKCRNTVDICFSCPI